MKISKKSVTLLPLSGQSPFLKEETTPRNFNEINQKSFTNNFDLLKSAKELEVVYKNIGPELQDIALAKSKKQMAAALENASQELYPSMENTNDNNLDMSNRNKGPKTPKPKMANYWLNKQ